MSILDQLRAWLGDRYTLERELGRGGMGAVYLARDLRLDRPVAIKVLPPEYAGSGALRDRFLRETRMAASFSHPNIVPVYAVEESDDLVAYVMSYVEGESLTDRVKRAGPLGTRDAVRLLQDVGYALAYAHGRGVVHRDIKPDNVMIERATGRALLMDFGVSRAIAAPTGGEGLTRVGEIVGTPEYMSPEQASGDQVDGRSDLYSLGLTAHFALTGTTVMRADSVGKVLARQLTEAVPPVRGVRPDVPAPLAEAVDRLVAKEPDARFPTAEALVEALDAARLAGPEVPVAVRMFAQEITTMSVMFIMAVLFSVVFLEMSPSGAGNLDLSVPLFFLFAMVFVRFIQTVREAHRLALSGFGTAEVQRGLAAILAERDARRAELAADEATRRARKRTVRIAAVDIVIALVVMRQALAMRVKIHDLYRVGLVGAVLLFAGLLLLAVGFMLLIRSPFRRSLGERVYRLVWLGAPGRALLHLAQRGVTLPTSGRTLSDASIRKAAPVVAGAPEPSAASQPHGDGDRLASLERRIQELERRVR